MDEVVMDIEAEALFRYLSDQTRLRCIVQILREEELCVCELTSALKLSQPKISRHLMQLREHNILKKRRQKIWVYYSLNPNLPTWAIDIIRTAVTAIQDTSPYREDSERINIMKKRPAESGRLC